MFAKARPRRPQLLALLLMAAVLLAACTPLAGASSAPRPSQRRSSLPYAASQYRPEPAGHEGGQVVVGHWQSPSNLSPLHNTETTAAIVDRALFAGLVVLDQQLGALPDLLTVVPTPDNGGVRTRADGPMEVTYRLRPGLRWSDGQPLTAADVEFTWHAITDPQSPKVRVPREGYQRIDHLDVLDATTVRATFASAYPPYLTLFPFVLPKHRLEAIPLAHLPEDRFWRQPDVVSGPYRIERMLADESITLVRNDHWSDGRNGRRPHLDRILYRLYPDKTGMIFAMQRGQLDVALGLGERDLDRVSGNFEVVAQPLLEYEQVTFNQQDPNPVTAGPPLWKDDPPLLEALDLAINRPEVERITLQGRGRMAMSPVVSGLPYPHSSELKPRRYDLAAANRMLDEDGWVRSPDGSTRLKGDQRLAFTLTTTRESPLRKMVEDVLVQSWLSVGAQVAVRELPAEVLFRPWPEGGLLSLARGQYEVALWTWVTGSDPDSIYQMEHSSQVPADANPAGANFGRFADPNVDRYLAAGHSRLDPLARAQAYQAFELAYTQYRHELPLFERLSLSLRGSRLHNFQPNPSLSTVFWNLADWWVSS